MAAQLPVLEHVWRTTPTMGSDFVPFETPPHDYPSNEKAFSNHVTGMLIQIHQISTIITIETDRFIQSRCWADQDDDINCVFKPEHFAASIRYFNLICADAVASITALGGRLSAMTWLHDPSNAYSNLPHNLNTMLATVKERHQSAKDIDHELITAMGLSDAQIAALDDIKKPELHAVPAASPREIRFWLTWNTKTKLRSLSDKIESGNVMEFYKELEASLIEEDSEDCPYPIRKVLPRLRHLKDKKSNRLFNPMVYFFCLGVDTTGLRAHKMIHIGATQERLQPWAALWKLRRDARLVRAGEDATRWANFVSGLMHVEKHVLPKTELELTDFRAQLMEWRLGLRANPPEGTDREDYDHIPVLRLCGGHVGQSFQLTDKGSPTLQCCPVCKLSIGYKECTDPKIVPSANIDLVGRAKVSWSCAELISSKYCDNLSMIRQSSSQDSQES
ncbi:hypothetical protein CDV36_000531 [Fusarium kuroshium]|uniref:Uncharacterized protein n=1 Tax=Fusarium kuroshium TaxID=2010991 RepID=A0A3M2SQK7_9HYPO|nr:hypothetical protein CDV36_000531 [Fusarium kuroshium]